MSWSGRVSNSRCSQEATERQMDSGVKKDDTSGRSATMRSTQPVPWATTLPVAQVAVGDGLSQQRPQQVVDVHGVRDQAAVDEELGRRLERHAPLLARGPRPPGPSGRRRSRWYRRPRPAAAADRSPVSGGPALRATAMGRAYHRAVIIGVDIGNSAAKAALVDGGTVHGVGPAGHLGGVHG